MTLGRVDGEQVERLEADSCVADLVSESHNHAAVIADAKLVIERLLENVNRLWRLCAQSVREDHTERARTATAFRPYGGTVRVEAENDAVDSSGSMSTIRCFGGC